MKHAVAVLVVVVATMVAAPGWAQHDAAVEVKAEVPALVAFHEVIYPLWHEAWPAKDVAMMRELLPQVQEHVAAVAGAALPGILRDKQQRWDTAAAQLKEVVARYEQAVAANDPQALADAVEALHSTYEGMVRIVRPVMAELDAYHQVLYRLYHYDWPASNLEAIRQDAAALVEACRALERAAVPKRFAAREAALKDAFAALCAATEALQATARDGEDLGALGSAVERTHTAYQAAEKVFE